MYVIYEFPIKQMHNNHLKKHVESHYVLSNTRLKLKRNKVLPVIS